MSASAEALAHPAAPGAGLLSGAERRWLGVRLTLALITGGLLVLSTVIRIVAPDQQDVAELVAGGAAVLAALPRSLQHGTACGTPIWTGSPINSSPLR